MLYSIRVMYLLSSGKTAPASSLTNGYLLNWGAAPLGVEPACIVGALLRLCSLLCRAVKRRSSVRRT